MISGMPRKMYVYDVAIARTGKNTGARSVAERGDGEPERERADRAEEQQLDVEPQPVQDRHGSDCAGHLRVEEGLLDRGPSRANR